MSLGLPGLLSLSIVLTDGDRPRGLFYPVEVSDWTFCASRFRQLMAKMQHGASGSKSGIAFAFSTGGFHEFTRMQVCWERMIRQSTGARE